MVHVRMEQLKDVTGALRPASVLTSSAAKSLNSSDTVEVQLNPIRIADVLINGKVVDFTGFDKLDFIGLRISRSNENGTEESFIKMDIVFKDPEISFRIMAYSNFLNLIIFTGSENLRGNIDGLMGNNNGIAEDDLRTNNGSSIPTNSTTATIHQKLGFKCAASPEHSATDTEHSIPISNTILTLSTPVLPLSIIAERQAGGRSTRRVNQSESLFTYPISRSYNSYQDEEFTPTIGNLTEPSTEALGVCVIRCGDSEYIPNGYWNATGTTENSTAILICDEGYVSNTTENILCNNEGNWTYSGPNSCEVLSCDVPLDIENGYWNTTGTAVNSRAVKMCDDGYITNTTEIIQCNSDGNWTYTEFAVCEPKDEATTSHWLTLRKLVIGLLVCTSGVLLVFCYGCICLIRTNRTKEFRA